MTPSLALLCVLALQPGDELAQRAELEAALERHAVAWSADRGAARRLAAYNAGTVALQLGRLPEAVLWLRRAEAGASGRDRWTADNLAAVRRLVGNSEPTGPTNWSLAASAASADTAAPWLSWGGVALAWTALALGLARGRARPNQLVRRRSRRALGALAAAAVLYLAGFALARWGPQQAVLLRPCPGLPMPPGREIWVLPGAEVVRILGPEAVEVCPAACVGLVEEP
jgi:hypothetical protein